MEPGLSVTPWILVRLNGRAWLESGLEFPPCICMGSNTSSVSTSSADHYEVKYDTRR